LNHTILVKQLLNQAWDGYAATGVALFYSCSLMPQQDTVVHGQPSWSWRPKGSHDCMPTLRQCVVVCVLVCVCVCVYVCLIRDVCIMEIF